MSEINLADLLAQAEAEGGGEIGGGYFEPEPGTYRCEVIKANSGTTSKQYPKFGFMVKVLEGEEAGNAFWFNVFLSASAKANNRAFGELAALGIEKDTIGLGPDAVVAAAQGAQVDVTVSYEDSDDPARPWMRTKLAPVTGDGWKPPTGDGPPAL